MRLLLFLCGYVSFLVPRETQTAFFEACRRLMITPKCPAYRENGVRLLLRRSEAKRLLAALGAESEAMIMERGGIPLLLRRFFRRGGLVAGTVLALMLFFFSTLFLFDIRIVGAKTVSEREMLEALERAGLSIGNFLPLVDTEGIEVSVREADNRIAYITVQIEGTVATVTVKEAVPEAPPLSDRPAHLIAKCDGIVTMPLVFEGKCLVSAGEVVRAGQILASGMIENEKGEVRHTRAAGQVMARTTQTFTVRAPLTYEEIVETARVKQEISPFFFGFEQKVFKNSGNAIDNCDIIESIYRPRVSAAAYLPLGIRRVEYREQTTVTKTRTATEALAAAERELAALLFASGEIGTVISKNVETIVDAEGITLVCTVVSEQDIASVAEFSLEAK